MDTTLLLELIFAVAFCDRCYFAHLKRKHSSTAKSNKKSKTSCFALNLGKGANKVMPLESVIQMSRLLIMPMALFKRLHKTMVAATKNTKAAPLATLVFLRSSRRVTRLLFANSTLSDTEYRHQTEQKDRNIDKVIISWIQLRGLLNMNMKDIPGRMQTGWVLPSFFNFKAQLLLPFPVNLMQPYGLTHCFVCILIIS